MVQLGLDPKGFKKGEQETETSQKRMREGAQRTAKDFEQVGKQISQAINQARNAVIGLLGVFTAGRSISSFVRDTTESSAALGRLSRDLNISTQALSAWEGVSRRVGNAAGQVTDAFQTIQAQIQGFRLYGSALSPVFQNLGIALADPITGAARSIEDIYRDVVEKLAQRAPQERLALAQGLGLGQETVNLAALPRAQRQAMLAEQQRLGTVSPEQAASAAALRVAFLNLEQALDTTGRRLLEDLTPAIIAVLDKLKDFALYLSGPDFRPTFDRLKEGIQSFADYLGSDDFKADLRSLGNGIKELAATIVRVLRFLGIIPRNQPSSDDQPTDRDYLLSGLTGNTPEEQMRMRQEREGRDRPGAPGTGRNVTGAAAAAAEEDIAYFMAQGWTREQAAGLAAQIQHESGGNPQAQGDRDENGRFLAHGILQWHPDRQAAFERWAGKPILSATREEQRAFMQFELMHGNERSAGRALRDARTAEEAGRLASRLYVRPGRDEAAREREARDRAATAGNLARRGAPASRPQEGMSEEDERREVDFLRRSGRIRPDGGLITGARGAALRDSRGAGSTTTNTSSNEANIGQVTVVTQATDAGGIARDLGSAIRRTLFVDQMTTGLA